MLSYAICTLRTCDTKMCCAISAHNCTARRGKQWRESRKWHSWSGTWKISIFYNSMNLITVTVTGSNYVYTQRIQLAFAYGCIDTSRLINHSASLFVFDKYWNEPTKLMNELINFHGAMLNEHVDMIFVFHPSVRPHTKYVTERRFEKKKKQMTSSSELLPAPRWMALSSAHKMICVRKIICQDWRLLGCAWSES